MTTESSGLQRVEKFGDTELMPSAVDSICERRTNNVLNASTAFPFQSRRALMAEMHPHVFEERLVRTHRQGISPVAPEGTRTSALLVACLHRILAPVWQYRY